MVNLPIYRLLHASWTSMIVVMNHDWQLNHSFTWCVSLSPGVFEGEGIVMYKSTLNSLTSVGGNN